MHWTSGCEKRQKVAEVDAVVRESESLGWMGEGALTEALYVNGVFGWTDLSSDVLSAQGLTLPDDCGEDAK